MNNIKSKRRQNPDKAKTTEKQSVFLALAEKMLSELSERTRDILRRRFGLLTGNIETLEKIGGRYGVTRERVRQIIAEATKNICKKGDSEVLLAAEDKILWTIRKNNGIIKESELDLIFDLKGARELAALKFLAGCSKKVLQTEERNVLKKAWAESLEILERAKKTINLAEEILQDVSKPLTEEKIIQNIQKRLENLQETEIFSYLKSAAKIKKNKFGKWGLVHWTEISPKGTREKVYLILKETGKPLHFREIANLIDKYALGKKKAHPQTVHNELIKDERFVLIGRGIYALAEWGYSAGTIQDVLKDILRKNEKPLFKDKILDEVLKRRKVKKTTIMINLNNNKLFERQGEYYSIKK